MAASRKTSVLLALMFMVLAFTSTANAQLPLGTLSCSATPVTPLVRAEGVAEAAGGIDIVCTNTPGASTEAVQYLLTNLNVLAANVNFTNSIGVVTGGGVDTTDAVVIINSNHSMFPSATSDVPPSGGDEADTRFPGPQYMELSDDTLLTANAMVFPVPGAPTDGVSLGDACTDFSEGGSGLGACFPLFTTIKIGNIRVNVSGLVFPAQVSVIVSMTGPNNIPIFPNVLNIALPLTGLAWSVEEPADPDEGPGLQCEGDDRHVEITLTEGFATSFKTIGVPSFIPGNTQWESGYFSPGSGVGDGGATQGTRFKIWFSNVPNGVDVSVDLSMNNATLNGETDDCSDPSNWGGDALCLHLISGADASGAGGSPAAYPGDDPTASNPSGTASVDIDSNGMGMVVYEVLDAHPFAQEESKIAAWFHCTANDEPTPGTPQIRVNLAPIASILGPYGFVADDVSPRPRFIDLGPQVTSVDIDIKPGGDPNSINCRHNGVIPLAILTTSTATGDPVDFDATTVDSSTVRFGPAGAMRTHPRAHIQDVDGDSDMDMVLHFRQRNTGIQCGDVEACLTGETADGSPIHGCDAIRTVGGKK